ncbi:MAG: hypothetical protein RLZZ283_1 [Candidatus Parcubacteria bacterium]|jgi:hypothetical protein
MNEIDWPYAYDLYQRVTTQARVNGTPIGDIRLVDGYALWPRVSQMVLSDDLKFFSATKRFDDVRARYDHLNRAPYTLTGFFVGAFAFLVSCIASLILVMSGRRVVVYGVDKIGGAGGADFRMQGVYEVLIARGVAYVEVLHTILGVSFFKHLFIRRRVAIYLEGIDWLYLTLRIFRRLVVARERLSITGLESCTAEEQKIAAAVIKKYIGAASLFRFRLSFLRFVLRKSRVQVVLSIDDARHYQELMIAARERSIPTYAFQHGQISPYFVGWLGQDEIRTAHADTLVVWNQYWKDELLRLKSAWSEDALRIGGSAKGMSALSLRRGSTNTVLVPYEIDAPLGIVRECIANLSQGGLNVLVKLRHDVPTQVQLDQYGITEEQTVRSLSDCPPLVAVIGSYSTFLYDAMMAGIPVGVIMSPLLFADGIVRNRLAIEVDATEPVRGVRLLAAMTEDAVEDIRVRVAAAPATQTVNAILDTHLV